MKNKARKNLNKDDGPDIILAIPEGLKNSCGNTEILRLINAFGNAKTVEEQITIIHSFSKYLKTPFDEDASLVLNILINLFVTANSKHPVKKSILRTFANSNHLESELSSELSTQLLAIINDFNSVAQYNDAVNSINDCFNNFSTGILAVNLILERVFPFLIDSLKFYLTELSGTTSPVALQELYKYIHNSTRALVAVSQQCENINQIMKEYINDIFKTCVTTLNNQDILYDTKNNCGIILIIASNIAFENGYSTLLLISDNENIISKWGITPKDFENDIIISCIYSGILNTVKPDQLCKYDDSFEQSDIYKMTDKLLEISTNCADKPTTILGVNRTLLLVSRLLEPLNDESLIKILPSFLDHIWTQLDHYIDTIRHVSRQMLTNLIKLAMQRNKIEQNASLTNKLKQYPLDIVIDSVLKTPVLRTGRYVALSIIGNEVGCEILLLKDQNLTKVFRKIAQESSISSYVTSCYENLMRCHLKETNEESWLKEWVLPLTAELGQDEEIDEKGFCYQKLLINAIKLRPSILSSILAQWSIDNELQYSSLLKCTLIARKIGTDLNDKSKWRGMLDYYILDSAKWHQNDESTCIKVIIIARETDWWQPHSILTWRLMEHLCSVFMKTKIISFPGYLYRRKYIKLLEIRISSLSLIAESHKSTEIFTEFELKFIVDFLHYNINTQLPATRQRILFLMKKVLTRFTESFRPMLRDLTKMQEKMIPSEIKDFKSQKFPQYEILLQHKKNYENFVFELRDCIFDSLFPGANFSRRIICLEVLTILDPIMIEVLKQYRTLPVLWKQYEVDALLLCLSDTYESNKQLATNLLKTCPVGLLKLNTVGNTKKFIDDALRYARSVKPADTATAAYMLETSMFSSVITDVLTELLQPPQNYSPEYLIINLLLNNLKQQIEIGQTNLLKAASSSPMHGTLFCIRHLMEKYLFSSNLNENYWKNILGDIIETCFKVSEIVCPVVNSSSPEGHLPMDHEAVDHEDEEVITAQMLLVCAWRSIKEVSLLLGEITLRAKIVGENSNGFITEEQMIRIGEHFTVLLTETKHRGAFEQAYVGFTKLCNRLWRCRAEKLHQLPITWLSDIISAISGENSAQNNKLCATRRSAGVPFMIQAIVVSELQTGASTHFHQCLCSLLQFANHSGDNIETRTHSMNILRALYRHTQLGEDISPYVAEGVIAAITGFSRQTWAERNSATLLFSSLMTRIFGVQRTRDTEKLNIRNKMTARVFFLRYPSLHAFLLNLLLELTDENCEPYKEVALYPILLLLARLYPASSEENDSNKQLQDFIPYVRICAKNKSLKTRELAAKALVPLVQAQHRTNLLKELFGLLTSYSGEKNYIHGILLQILYLIPTLAVNVFDGDAFKEEIKDTLWLLTCNNSECCPIIASLYMQIISKIFVRESKPRCIISKTIFSVISSQDNYIKKDCIIGKTMYYRESMNLQLKLLIDESDWKICPFLVKHLQHENEDVKEFILNFMICLLRNSNTAVHIDNLEIPDHEKLLTNLISEKFKADLMSNLQHYIKKIVVVLKLLIVTNPNLLSKTVFVLCNLQEGNELFIKDKINYFNMLEKYPEDQEVMSAVLSCFPSLIRNVIGKNMTNDLKPILKITSEAAKYDLSCRYYAALTLLELRQIILGINQIEMDFENVLLMWKTIMVLLSDSEPTVRNTISKLAMTRNPIAEKSREELVSLCTSMINQLRTTYSKEKCDSFCISLLLFWAMIGSDSEDTDEDIELQIFERGEVSTYIEDMCLSKLSAKDLKIYFLLDDIPNIFTKIVIILEEDKDIIWDANKTDRDNLIIVLKEIQHELNSSRGSNENILKKYFDSENNTWFSLDVFFKYKFVNILKAVMPDDLMYE